MTQEKAILTHLKKVGAITPLQALQSYGCFRLGARIYDLKQKGHKIKKRMIRSGKSNYAEYSL